MLKHPRIGRYSSCISSGACLASTSRRLQKETPNSGYRVTESDERARSVTERRQYPRVVPGRPHNAQTSTHWPLFIVQHPFPSEERFMRIGALNSKSKEDHRQKLELQRREVECWRLQRLASDTIDSHHDLYDWSATQCAQDVIGAEGDGDGELGQDPIGAMAQTLIWAARILIWKAMTWTQTSSI